MNRLCPAPLSTRLISLLSLAAFALAVLAGCNSSNFNAPPETIAATSGSNQSATVNTTFSAPLVSTVTMGGKPVNGAFVVFTAPSSGASGTFANGTNTETDTTNSSGIAQSSPFTANGILGTETVTASLADATASAPFTLTNTSGPAASFSATSGSLQDAVISTAFQAPLVVTVFDAYGNPVTGASVTFTAPGSGASGIFASNSSPTETDTTNSSGVATSSTFTANSTLGSYPVTATVSGVSGTSVNFKLANVTGPLLSIAPSGGTPQSANVLAAFAAPLSVMVVDSSNNPVSGALVTFEVPSSGASGSFAGGVKTATTNSSGIATSAPFSANGTVGTYTVTATVNFGAATNAGAEPADFVLTNSPLYYAFYLSGQEAIDSGPKYYALAGSFMIDGNGNVLGGEQDYNDGSGLTSPEPSGDSITSGTLASVGSTPGLTTLTLNTNNSSVGSSGAETFAVQFVNANHALISQFDGSATSSGSLDLQTLSSSVSNGNYAFTLSGIDASALSTAFGGVFSISQSGTQLSGNFDANDSSVAAPVLDTAFTGTISAPDSFGRGTITSSLGISLNYYLVGPEAICLIDVDTTDSAVGSAFGQGTGTFSNASLANSIFGVESNSAGQQYAAAGMFATVPVSGTGPGSTFSGVADDDEFSTGESPVVGASISGTYSIGANGYGSLAVTSGQLGDLSAFGIYMTDPNLNITDPNNTSTGLGGALLLDLDAPSIGGTPTTLNGTGIVLTRGSTATSAFAGAYAFGTQAFHLPRIAPLGSEYDFAGQTTVNSLALSSAKGLLSDPFAIFNSTGSDGTDKATFAGTATPSTVAGRYTMSLTIAVSADPVLDPVAIYQGSGGSQLLWLDVDSAATGTFLGILQQQGSLSGVPAVASATSTVGSKRRR